jgi:hypothetical protein
VKYDVENLYNINRTHKDAGFVQHEAERGRSDLNINTDTVNTDFVENVAS